MARYPARELCQPRVTVERSSEEFVDAKEWSEPLAVKDAGLVAAGGVVALVVVLGGWLALGESDRGSDVNSVAADRVGGTEPATPEIEDRVAAAPADSGDDSETEVEDSDLNGQGPAPGSSELGSSEAGSGPNLVNSQPSDGEAMVSIAPGFRFQFDAALSQGSIETATYLLVDATSGERREIDAATISLDLTAQNLSFALSEVLDAEAEYRLSVSGLEGEDGAEVGEVLLAFRTEQIEEGSVAFSREAIDDVFGPTVVEIGPDGHLYVATITGTILRYSLDADGQPTGESETLITNGGFQFVGLAFEPGQPDVVWVSQWSRSPSDEFSSEIAAYDLATGAETKKVLGLPRHPVRGDHSVQSIRFRGDKLYASVGGVTTSGVRSFQSWGDPVLAEVPVSASVIEIDYQTLTSPAVVRDSEVLPDSSPIRLFATGLRNAYDMVWHSNGQLYANINQNSGSGPENGAAPSEGPCEGHEGDVETFTIPDTLNLIRRGAYYGHPNPSRGECVVMGGGQGRFAVRGYSADQASEPAFDETLIAHYQLDGGAFGVSVNGIDEYRGPGPLRGALVSADFSGSRSIVAVPLSDGVTSRLAIDGELQRLTNGSGEPHVFVHPLDVTVGLNGQVYVADFGEWGGGRFGENGSIAILQPDS